MSALLARLAHKPPALWIEVAPPRGVDPAFQLKTLAALVGHADAINLTDNALGNVKMSGVIAGSIIRTRLKIPVVVNFSCRDRNRFALTSDLLGAGALEIDAIVAVTGDKIPSSHPSGARSVHDLDAFGLLAIVRELNRGNTGDGNGILRTIPNIVAGAVANPNRKELEREIELLRRKAQADASFVITQPIFQAAAARPFLQRAREVGIKTVIGILPLKRAAMADYLKHNVAELSAAAGQLSSYAGMNEEQVRRQSIRDNLELMKSLADEVDGFNIMSGGGPSLAIELALEFNRWRKESGRTAAP